MSANSCHAASIVCARMACSTVSRYSGASTRPLGAVRVLATLMLRSGSSGVTGGSLSSEMRMPVLTTVPHGIHRSPCSGPNRPSTMTSTHDRPERRVERHSEQAAGNSLKKSRAPCRFGAVAVRRVNEGTMDEPLPNEEGDTPMSRYMLILRSTPEAEKAMEEQNIDFEQIIESMGRYNEELIKAGVLLAGDGLAGPEDGFVVNFDSDPPVVTDGPYTEAKELFNGFWILGVSSIEEARQWALKCPLGLGARLEVRRITETEEFPQDNEWVQKELRWKKEGVWK
jgi:hypothetical protein